MYDLLTIGRFASGVRTRLECGRRLLCIQCRNRDGCVPDTATEMVAYPFVLLRDGEEHRLYRVGLVVFAVETVFSTVSQEKETVRNGRDGVLHRLSKKRNNVGMSLQKEHGYINF